MNNDVPLKAPFTRFTFEERVHVEEGLKNNFSFAKIAKTLGRTPSSIQNEVRKNGRRESYTARKAEDRAKELHANRYIKQSEIMRNYYKSKPDSVINPKARRLLNIEDSIICLNEQVKILFEIIKDIRK